MLGFRSTKKQSITTLLLTLPLWDSETKQLVNLLAILMIK